MHRSEDLETVIFPLQKLSVGIAGSSAVLLCCCYWGRGRCGFFILFSIMAVLIYFSTSSVQESLFPHILTNTENVFLIIAVLSKSGIIVHCGLVFL